VYFRDVTGLLISVFLVPALILVFFASVAGGPMSAKIQMLMLSWVDLRFFRFIQWCEGNFLHGYTAMIFIFFKIIFKINSSFNT